METFSKLLKVKSTEFGTYKVYGKKRGETRKFNSYSLISWSILLRTILKFFGSGTHAVFWKNYSRPGDSLSLEGK